MHPGKDEMIRWTGLLVGGVMLLSACSAAVQPDAEDEEFPVEEPAPTQDVDLVPPSGVVDLQKLTPQPGDGENIVQPAPGVPDPSVRIVELAKQALAEETDRDAAEIETVLVEAVDWPDSSLGCPQPGEGYLQVITPGYRIVLQIEDVNYTFHSDQQTRVVHCAAD